jgi:membrane protein DedA with SNARE-associated domain
MHELTQRIIEAIQTHGALAVFVGVIIESIIIPIPSPLIIMGAGALLIPIGEPASKTFLDIVRLIVIPGSVAETIGAFFGWGIGFIGGKPAIVRFQKFIGLTWPEVERFQKKLVTTRGWLLMVLLRTIPIVPLSLISVAAGVMRWPAPSFALWTWLGAIPRCLILGYLGWLTRDAYHALAHRVDKLESLSSAVIVLGTVGIILWLRSRMAKR